MQGMTGEFCWGEYINSNFLTYVFKVSPGFCVFGAHLGLSRVRSTAKLCAAHFGAHGTSRF